ncbi:hypothetical protein, partial [Vreelandella glaciei]|uniref:hypothetical protein n=1 Tax=Vreelandella glaciei TaxID=186761 RepID=UPI0005F7A75F
HLYRRKPSHPAGFFVAWKERKKPCHGEERSDAAISSCDGKKPRDRHASLAMTHGESLAVARACHGEERSDVAISTFGGTRHRELKLPPLHCD